MKRTVKMMGKRIGAIIESATSLIIIASISIMNAISSPPKPRASASIPY